MPPHVISEPTVSYDSVHDWALDWFADGEGLTGFEDEATGTLLRLPVVQTASFPGDGDGSIPHRNKLP